MSTPKPLPTGHSARGAQMGRASTRPHDRDEDLTVRPIMPDPHGYAYDAAGAYWGIGAQVWRAESETGTVCHVRAETRKGAASKIRDKFPNASLDVWPDVSHLSYEDAKQTILDGRRAL